MNINEAYDAMQKGHIVTHKCFIKGEFLYMNENFVIHDENGYDYEESWDTLLEDREFRTGWSIYKGVKEEQKKLLGVVVAKKEKQIMMVSHIQGKPCPGKNKCFQFGTEGESACLFCDVNRHLLNVDSDKPLLESVNDYKEDSVLHEDIIDVDSIDTEDRQSLMQLSMSSNNEEDDESYRFTPGALLLLIIEIITIVIIALILLL